MAGTASDSLAYAVRGRVVVHFHGEFCLALTGVAAVPALFAASSGAWHFAVWSGLVAAILLATWWLSTRLDTPRQLRGNEALVIVAGGYLFTALLMTLPLASDGIPVMDAFFQSMSAITTTGLSTAGPASSRSEAFLFTSAWMQWCGGLVVIVLAVLLIEPGAAARQLAGTDIDQSDLAAGARARARWALVIYSALTFGAWVVMLALGGGLFDSLLHVLSAVSTGGFSTHDDSLAGLPSRSLQVALMLATLAGATSFSRYRAFAMSFSGESRWRSFFDVETRTLLLLCLALAAWLGLTLSMAGGMPWREALWTAPLLAVSAQSTAGFTPVDVATLPAAAKLGLVLAMFVGGGLGSTAGGIKVMRLLLLLRLMRQFVAQPALPQHAVVKTRVGGRLFEEQDLRQALGLVGVFTAVVLASWAAFLTYGHAPLDALFEVVSATGTVGLSTGLSSSELQAPLKGVLCLDMWMGRLEILAVLVLLRPHTWIGRRS